MSSIPEKEKKPRIRFNVSENGNIIDASIDEKTHFISFRRTLESSDKATLGMKGGKEKQEKVEWQTFVWEDGTIMPESVWNDKKRKELSDEISSTITLATGSEHPVISTGSGTVVPWSNPPPLKQCVNCRQYISSNAKKCPSCGARFD